VKLEISSRPSSPRALAAHGKDVNKTRGDFATPGPPANLSRGGWDPSLARATDRERGVLARNDRAELGWAWRHFRCMRVLAYRRLTYRVLHRYLERGMRRGPREISGRASGISRRA